MTRRYYAAAIPALGGLVALTDEEAVHAARVMRARVGDVIELFDGEGNQATASIQSIDKRHCIVVASAPRAVSREPARQLHMGIAFPKPERTKEMIERLTELGVHRITPIRCERTQRPPNDSLLDKLRRIVIESSKQCERNLLMKIDDVVPLQTFIDRTETAMRWIAHPGGDPISNVVSDGMAFDRMTSGSMASGGATEESDGSKTVAALVGPEGGFNDAEYAAALQAGYHGIELGNRIYRIETAATVIAAYLAG